MTLSRRQFVLAGAAGFAALPVHAVPAQDVLDAIPEGPLRDQVAWVIGMLNTSGETATAAEIEAHFSPRFLQEVAAAEVIAIFGQMGTLLGPVSVVRVEPGASESEASVLLAGETGLFAILSITVEQDSGLIIGLFLQPAEDPSVATPVSTDPGVSPAAAPVAASMAPPATDEILADYQAASAALGDAGRAVTDAFIAGDGETFTSLFSAEAVVALAGFSAQEYLAELTTDIVSFSIPELRAYFAGHFEPGSITGLAHQGLPSAFMLTPELERGEGYPTGRWTGDLVFGGQALSIEITFSGTADTLAATLTIPQQLLLDHPLTDVRFDTARPLGDLMEERALPMGTRTGTTHYAASYAWGDMTLVLNSGFNEANEAIAFSALMQPPLPPDPAAGVDVPAGLRLPFDGAWLVIWGGDTEFRNYHAPSPITRHAYDIVIWRDGASYTGDGSRNEDYHCYGQPQYAPAAGTVVAVQDGVPDSVPASPQTPGSPEAQVGNHIVIEIAEGAFLLMAHFQPGSIAVAEGDTVAPGELVGLTGNSGYSSEPHVHIHLQSTPDIFDPATVGLPLAFAGFTANGEPVESAPLLQGQIVERV